mgnify:CR=1 FL=1
MNKTRVVWEAFKKWLVVAIVSFFLYYVSFYNLLNVQYYRGISDITALSLLFIAFIVYCYERIKWEEKKLAFVNRMREIGLSEKEAEWILTFPKDFIRNLLQITAQRYYDSIVKEEKKKEEVIVVEPI